MKLLNWKMRWEKKAITQIFKKYGYKPVSIEGSHLPDFMMFQGWMKFAGTDVSLVVTSQKIRQEELVSHQKLWKIHGDLDSARYKACDSFRGEDVSVEQWKEKATAFLKGQYEAQGEQLKAAYEDALKEELKVGLVRIAYLPELLDQEAKAKSHYHDGLVNYSPVLLYITKLSSDNMLENMAELFTQAYMRLTPCSLIDVYLGREIQEKELLDVYTMMGDVLCVLNRWKTAEFLKKKDNVKYQHRHDVDPSKF